MWAGAPWAGNSHGANGACQHFMNFVASRFCETFPEHPGTLSIDPDSGSWAVLASGSGYVLGPLAWKLKLTDKVPVCRCPSLRSGQRHAARRPSCLSDLIYDVSFPLSCTVRLTSGLTPARTHASAQRQSAKGTRIRASCWARSRCFARPCRSAKR